MAGDTDYKTLTCGLTTTFRVSDMPAYRYYEHEMALFKYPKAFLVRRQNLNFTVRHIKKALLMISTYISASSWAPILTCTLIL